MGALYGQAGDEQRGSFGAGSASKNVTSKFKSKYTGKFSNYERSIRENHKHILKGAGDFGLGWERKSKNKNSVSKGNYNKKQAKKTPPLYDARFRKNSNVSTKDGILLASSNGLEDPVDILFTLVKNIEADTDDSNTTLNNFLKRQLENKDKTFEQELNQGVLKLPQGPVISRASNKIIDPYLTKSSSVRANGFSGAGLTGAGGGGGGSAGISASGGTIGLPTPDNLVENIRLGYTSRSKPLFAAIQNALQAGVRAAATGLIDDNQRDSSMAQIQDIAKSLTGSLEEGFAKSGNDTLMNLIRLGNMVGDNGGASGLNSFNNTMLQQFSGVEPRTFSFQWKLYAADGGQSSTIFQIIKLLKQAAHPELVPGILDIVKYPMILQRFDVRGPHGAIIFPIFESVISGITVDYSASGAPYFFKSGAPVSIGLNLTITEIRSLTRGDFA